MEAFEKTLRRHYSLIKKASWEKLYCGEGGGNRPYLLHLGGDCFCRDHKTRELTQLRRRQQRKCR